MKKTIIKKDETALECPFCKSPKKKRNGHSPNKLQRYRCKNCGRTYSKRTGTILHSIKKESAFLQHAIRMQQGFFTLKEMASEFKITTSTAFYWRHKILLLSGTEGALNSIAEAGLTEIFFNQKGKKSQPAHFFINIRKQRCKTMIISDYSDLQTNKIRLISVNNQDPESCPPEFINQFRGKNIVPVSNYDPYLYQIFKAHNLHKKLTQVDPFDINAPAEIKRIPVLKRLFKTLIHQKARGVSGKYLNNYANWLNLLLNCTNVNMEHIDISDNSIWVKYTLLERLFSMFMKRQKANWYLRTDNRIWKSNNKYAFSGTLSYSSLFT